MLAAKPIFHRKAERVRGHVFLCMLAYYVEWHMGAKVAPLLFDEEDKAGAQQDKRKSEGNSRALLHLRRYRKTASNLVVRHPRFVTAIHSMGIEALYRKPRLSQGAAGHTIYPYLLSGGAIDRPNQVWAAD
jgi:hypothetical protein